MQTHLHFLVSKATPIAPQAEWLSSLADQLYHLNLHDDEIQINWRASLCAFKFFKKGSLHWAWSPSLNTLWVFLLLPPQANQEKPTSPIRSLYLHTNGSSSAQFSNNLNPKTARQLQSWLRSPTWAFPLITPTTSSLVHNINVLHLKLPSGSFHLTSPSNYHGPTTAHTAHLPLLASALVKALNRPIAPQTLTKWERRQNKPTTTVHLPTELERWKRCGKSLRSNPNLRAQYYDDPWAGYVSNGDFKTFNPKHARNHRRSPYREPKEKYKVALALEWQLALHDDTLP